MALTFVGTLALLSLLLAIVMPAVIGLSTRSLIEQARASFTEQTWVRAIEDQAAGEFLFQHQIEEAASRLRLVFEGSQAGEWLEQPGLHRRELESWLAAKQAQLGLSLLTLVDRRGVTVARGSNPGVHGDRLFFEEPPAGTESTGLKSLLEEAMRGRETAGVALFPPEVLAQEKGRPPRGFPVPGSGGAEAAVPLSQLALVRGGRSGPPRVEKRGLMLVAVQPVRNPVRQIVGVALGARLLNNDPGFLRSPGNVLPRTNMSLFLENLCVASQPPNPTWPSWAGLDLPAEMVQPALRESRRGVLPHRIGQEEFLSGFLPVLDVHRRPVGVLLVSRHNDLERLDQGLQIQGQQAQQQGWRIMLVEVLLTSFLALLLASLAATRIVGPIRQLRDGARVIGSGDFDHRLDIRTGDEIEDLAGAFNEMADRLQEARRQDRLALVGRMAGTIIHDIRNPLTTIRGYTPLLLEAGFSDEERKGFERIIVDATEHIADMVQELLDYSRGEERSLNLQPQRWEDFLDDLEPLLRREFEETEVEVSVNVVRDATVALDRHAMQRVIHNLAANARDAMGGRGRFTLEVDRENGQAVLRIKDTGPGLPEEVRDRLFEPFVTHGKAHGTGLGLTICKQFVEAHGGQIDLASEPGVGTTVTLRLPVVEGNEGGEPGGEELRGTKRS